mgnify:CR=1 FL=1
MRAQFIVVNTSVLPEIFEKVLEVKNWSQTILKRALPPPVSGSVFPEVPFINIGIMSFTMRIK